MCKNVVYNTHSLIVRLLLKLGVSVLRDDLMLCLFLYFTNMYLNFHKYTYLQTLQVLDSIPAVLNLWFSLCYNYVF